MTIRTLLACALLVATVVLVLPSASAVCVTNTNPTYVEACANSPPAGCNGGAEAHVFTHPFLVFIGAVTASGCGEPGGSYSEVQACLSVASNRVGLMIVNGSPGLC